MKKIIFCGAMLFFSVASFAQETHQSAILTSIQNDGNRLILNDSIYINKGGELQVYLPAGGKDFVFVKPQKSGFGLKMLSGIADAVSTGALAVGVGGGSLETLQSAVKVMQGARAIQYGADALDKINNLPISKNAKKIAGKKFTVLGWEVTDDGYILLAEYNKKKYEIYLQEAVMAGEVKL